MSWNCEYCSHRPTSDSDYCDEHRPILSSTVDKLLKRVRAGKITKADRTLIIRVINQLRN
jgi:hypothetical protein